MIRFPYIDSNGCFMAEVEINNAADVFLVNEGNYRKYISGKAFRYYGGHYTRAPVHTNVNGIGRYYLIVNDSRHYRYRFSL